jgi:uncharacterized protein
MPARRRTRAAPGAVLLAPGASAEPDHRTLVALEAGLAPLPVRRFKVPGGRAPRAVAAVVEAASAVVESTGIAPAQLVLGGRSYGGRMCSMAVAEGLPAAGLVLLSYPLHPPGKPQQLRTDHFGDLRVPCLFVSGEKDPFGAPDELTAATEAIAGPVTHVWLPGGHSPARGQDPVIVETVRSWLDQLS